MDKISKALKKLSAKERARVKEILLLVSVSSLETLGVKKFRGRKDIFRVRKGKIRIIYRSEKSGIIFVLAIERRSEKIYRKV